MLRALKATDVGSIHEINKDALGYDFSPEETASQLTDRKSTRLNSSHIQKSRMPSSA